LESIHHEEKTPMKLNDLLPIPANRTMGANPWRPPAGVRFISTDDHNREPEHLWEERLPAKWKDKAPKYWKDAEGWHFEAEGRSLIPKGVTAGVSEGLEGFWNLDKKIEHMDAEGIEVGMLFHGRFQALNGLQDKELYWACADVYNEWLIEYARPHAKRLVAIAILPTFLKPEASKDYIQKLKQLGFKALQMPSFPRGVRYNSMEMEPLWTAIEESGIPLQFHVGAYIEFHGNGSLGANIARNLCPYRGLFGQLVFAGVFDRHPKLKVVFTEGGATWVAQALSDMDYIVRTYHGDLRPKLGHMPSEYWNRQCYASFIVDPPAMELVDRIGAHTMMWGSDYPHAEGTWTYSGEVAKSIWDAVGPEKGAMILGGNAAKLWNL
jgi:predicted TIM-barrel fold metal-dependent hydrolase